MPITQMDTNTPDKLSLYQHAEIIYTVLHQAGKELNERLAE